MANIREVLEYWEGTTLDIVDAHFESSVMFGRYHTVFGLVLVFSSSLLTILVSNNELIATHPVLDSVKIALSFVVPILSAMLAFLGFQKKSILHHGAAASFASINRNIQIIRKSDGSDIEIEKQIIHIKEVWDQSTRDAPALSFGRKYWINKRNKRKKERDEAAQKRADTMQGHDEVTNS